LPRREVLENMHEKNRRKLKKKLNQKNIENAIEFFIAEESLFK